MGEKNFIAPSVLSVCFLVALLAPAKAAAGSNLEDVTQLTKAQQDQAERLAEQKRLLDQQAKELAEQRRELEALRELAQSFHDLVDHALRCMELI